MHLFITGKPGVGKSTLVEETLKVCKRLGGAMNEVSGFITQKTDDGGVYMHPVDMKFKFPGTRPVDHVDSRKYTDQNRIGTCGGRDENGNECPGQVFPAVFEQYGLSLLEGIPVGSAILMDELGVMESASPAFCARVMELLDGPYTVIAVVKQAGTPFLDALLAHPHAKILEITEQNREARQREAVEILRKRRLVVALGLKRKDVVSIVGAGGKTSLLYGLAEELNAYNFKVIMTTTTHFQRPGSRFLREGDAAKGRRCIPIHRPTRENVRMALMGKVPVVVGLRGPSIKATPPGQDDGLYMPSANSRILDGEGCSPAQHSGKDTEFTKEEQLEDLRLYKPEEPAFGFMRMFSDYLLIEADGARCLPCKAPLDSEPVLHESTTMVVGVYGMNALGLPINEGCHNADLVAELLGKTVEDTLLPADMAKLAASQSGLRKDVGDKRFAVVINQADTLQRMATAREIAAQMKELGVPKVLICALKYAPACLEMV